jgi:E3 ubiquitin-protein ligase RNF115/126
MMAQYLMMLMGHRAAGGARGGNDPFATLLGLGGDGQEPSGRWGDYVFGQEALDRIMTQLMENANAHRPVPATEEIINNLPKVILEEGCELIVMSSDHVHLCHPAPLLEKDCAVCKEQFSLQTEDPDEQVVLTLPCKHPFHESCIVPWLKSSGTCPVCR